MTFWCRRCSVHSRSPRWMTRAVRVGEHLHLDVARALDEPLEQQRVVAERRGGHAAGGRERLGQLGRRSRTTCMPLPPPPAEGLTSSG